MAIYSLGIMTGTSCDGADLALLRFHGNPRAPEEALVHSGSSSFPAALRSRLRAAQKGRLSIRDTAILTRDYSTWLATIIEKYLRKWPVPRESILIGVHGQTVWHEPKNEISVQLVDASIIAAKTGCTVTTAFRQPDLARGGEGAPLVPYYHWLRATSNSKYAKSMPFAIQNIGGIGNMTYVSKNLKDILAFDTGPGNALIDLATEKATSGKLKYDRGGQIALSNIDEIDWKTIRKLGRHPYFIQKPPKSTGRELFNEEFLKKIPGSKGALVANATALTAHSMAKAYNDFILKKRMKLNAVFLAGGGAQNPVLVKLFAEELERIYGEVPIQTLPVEFAPPQFLEAMAFARLGFEAIQGRPVSLSIVTGAEEDAAGAAIYPGKNYAKLLKLLNMR